MRNILPERSLYYRLSVLYAMNLKFQICQLVTTTQARQTSPVVTSSGMGRRGEEKSILVGKPIKKATSFYLSTAFFSFPSGELILCSTTHREAERECKKMQMEKRKN